MSYALAGYLIDLEKLRSAVGSRDKALIKAVIDEDPKAFAAAPSKDDISLKDALTHLIMGEPMDARSAHQYGYALEQFCRHLGTRVESRRWDTVRLEALEDTGIEKLMDKNGPPVALPSIRDFPAIGHVPASAIRAALDEVQERYDAATDDDLRDLLSDYEGWLLAALEQNKSLVLFYY